MPQAKEHRGWLWDVNLSRWLGASDQGPVDLSENSDFLLTLIDRPLQWRERLVEEFTFHGAAHVRVASSYQIDFPPELIRAYVDVGRHRKANALLPLTTREKQPLLNLDIVGPGGAPAHLLSRASIAELEAEYLRRLIETSPARSAIKRGLPDPLLEAICVFTPDYFNSLVADEGHDRERALTRYLASGLGGRLPVTVEQVRAWREQTREATDILRAQGGWLPSGTSSAEEPLLAIPRLDPLPASEVEIEHLLGRFRDAVLAAARNRDDVLLRAMAEYGRRYELIVEVEVPLLEAVHGEDPGGSLARVGVSSMGDADGPLGRRAQRPFRGSRPRSQRRDRRLQSSRPAWRAARPRSVGVCAPNGRDLGAVQL